MFPLLLFFTHFNWLILQLETCQFEYLLAILVFLFFFCSLIDAHVNHLIIYWAPVLLFLYSSNFSLLLIGFFLKLNSSIVEEINRFFSCLLVDDGAL